MASTKTKNADGSAANLGFETKLWLTADKLRNNMLLLSNISIERSI